MSILRFWFSFHGAVYRSEGILWIFFNQGKLFIPSHAFCKVDFAVNIHDMLVDMRYVNLYVGVFVD